MPDTENKGHRQRLRERFASGEESSRSEEALLELLLTYAIPQKDVQPLAKRLLSEYGSLPALLENSMETLCQFDGVKENSAVLLKLVECLFASTMAPNSPAKKHSSHRGKPRCSRRFPRSWSRHLQRSLNRAVKR